MSTEVTKAKQVRQMLNSDMVKDQIAKALPTICKPERFMRIAMTAITKNPKIADTTQESMMSCLLDCAQLGIEPDGRRAHLIPYKDTCTLIIDYKGLVELVRRSGEIKTIHADVVCENDQFEVNLGKITKHVIDYKKDRGEPYCYYAYAEMKDGSIQSETMTVKEIEKVRNASRGKNATPWTQHFQEMAKKTVFRRLCKWLPMAVEVVQKLQEVERMEFDFEMPKAEPKFKTAEEINDVEV